MKNNTYDATGYKFGFMVVGDELFRDGAYSSLEKSTSPQEAIDICNEKIINHANIVDFSDLDGLTFKELLDIPVFNEKLIIFCIYNQVNLENQQYNNLLGVEFLDTKYIDDKNEKVDDYLCSYLEENYDFRPPRVQEYMKCFLERYKYSSMEEVDKVLLKTKENN